MTGKKAFISDFGEPLEMRSPEGVVGLLPRYGVWKWDPIRGRHQVADTGNDLDALRILHGALELVSIEPGRRTATPRTA